jgi:hypothetical protein
MRNSIITFYETKAFLKKAKKLLGDERIKALKLALAANPKAGDVIIGGAGLRKLRWTLEGRGKRGGARIIYFYVDERGLVSLLACYAKNEKEDLRKDELKDLVSIARAIRSSL